MDDLDTAMSTTGSIPTAANRRHTQGVSRDPRVHNARESKALRTTKHTERQSRTTDCGGSYLYGVIRIKFNTNLIKFNTRASLRRVGIKFNTEVRRAY